MSPTRPSTSVRHHPAGYCCLLGDPAVALARRRADRAAAYRQPSARTDIALAGRKRLLLRAGLDPAAPVAEVSAQQWHRLAILLGGPTVGAN